MALHGVWLLYPSVVNNQRFPFSPRCQLLIIPSYQDLLCQNHQFIVFSTDNPHRKECMMKDDCYYQDFKRKAI